jgi:hypothetical protein
MAPVVIAMALDIPAVPSPRIDGGQSERAHPEGRATQSGPAGL